MILTGAASFKGFQFSLAIVMKFILLVLAWSIQSHAEEVIARGWLFTRVSRKNNILLGVISSSLFFAVLHLANDGIAVLPIIDLFLFGVFAALFMMKTGNIWAVSGFHAAWNCFQGNVFSFPVSGTDTGDAFIKVVSNPNSWLSGGEFGVEGSIVSVAVQLILIIWLYYDLFLKQGKSPFGKLKENEVSYI